MDAAMANVAGSFCFRINGLLTTPINAVVSATFGLSLQQTVELAQVTQKPAVLCLQNLRNGCIGSGWKRQQWAYNPVNGKGGHNGPTKQLPRSKQESCPEVCGRVLEPGKPE
jgi:hypothetical protein